MIINEKIFYAKCFFITSKPPTMILNVMVIARTMFYFIGYKFWHIGQHKLYSNIIYFQKAVFQNTILCKLSFNKRSHTKINIWLQHVLPSADFLLKLSFLHYWQNYAKWTLLVYKIAIFPLYQEWLTNWVQILNSNDEATFFQVFLNKFCLIRQYWHLQSESILS